MEHSALSRKLCLGTYVRPLCLAICVKRLVQFGPKLELWNKNQKKHKRQTIDHKSTSNKPNCLVAVAVAIVILIVIVLAFSYTRLIGWLSLKASRSQIPFSFSFALGSDLEAHRIWKWNSVSRFLPRRNINSHPFPLSGTRSYSFTKRLNMIGTE